MRTYFVLTAHASADYVKTTLETSGEDVKTTLETSGEDVKTTSNWSVVLSVPLSLVNGLSEENGYSRPVMYTYTKVKPHSQRVKKIQNYTRNEWRRCKTTLEASGEHQSPSALPAKVTADNSNCSITNPNPDQFLQQRSERIPLAPVSAGGAGLPLTRDVNGNLLFRQNLNRKSKSHGGNHNNNGSL
jgi:hypothetical protein